jgi:hypothetical protein
MVRLGELPSAATRVGASPSSKLSVALALAFFGLSTAPACERKPPEPKPLASLAEEAEIDGLPFSAACQSWRIADFDKHAPAPEKSSAGRQRLDAIWKGMIKDHLDPTLACLDWPRVHASQVKALGDAADSKAVDASFKKVFGQLGSEAPRIGKKVKRSKAKGEREVVKGSRAVLYAYDSDGTRLPGRPEPKLAPVRPEGEEEAPPPKPKKRNQPVYVPPGMSLAWWTLGSWTVQAVKQIEGALKRVGDAPESIPTVIDLRDTGGSAMRSALRLLGTCTDKNRTLGEVNDRKGKRDLKVKRNDKFRLGEQLLVITSERSSAVSQFFAYSAVTECGAAWWYEVEGKKPKKPPERARRPVWSETLHSLPGGGQMRVRSSHLDLQARVAGPTPVAELRTLEQTTDAEILAHFEGSKER